MWGPERSPKPGVFSALSLIDHCCIKVSESGKPILGPPGWTCELPTPQPMQSTQPAEVTEAAEEGLLLLLCVQGQHSLGQAHWAVGVWGWVRGYCRTGGWAGSWTGRQAGQVLHHDDV